MTREELKAGKITVIQKSIDKIYVFLASGAGNGHRNILAQQKRRLKKLMEKLDAYKAGIWTAEDEMYYKNLYEHKPYTKGYISAL